jgi:hypothetical protein
LWTELLDLWGQFIEPVTTMLALASQTSSCQLVFDALTHEHDIRGALSEPDWRPGDLAFTVAMDFVTTTGDQFIRQADVPALGLTTPTIGSVQLGDPRKPQHQVALDISDFEALRAFGGRRSLRQLLALPWTNSRPPRIAVRSTSRAVEALSITPPGGATDSIR